MKSREESRNKELYSAMNKKEKIRYIWEYYKFHIIVPIIILMIIVSFAHSIMNRKSSVFNLTFTSQVISVEGIADLKNYLTKEMIGEDEKKKEVMIQSLSVNEESELGMAEIQKLVAQVSTGDVNIMIMDKDTYKNYCEQGYFVNLKEIKDEVSLDKFNGKLLDQKGNPSEDKAYKMDLTANSFFKDRNIDVEGYILGIVIQSNNIENTYKFINDII